MRFVLLILNAIFFVNSSIAQISSSCEVPSQLNTDYRRDIVQLATHRLFQNKSPDTVNVRIPKQYIDSIAEGMAAIINALSLPEGDSVFNMYCVHNNNGWPGLYGGFLVKVDTSYSWTQAWQNHNTLTSNPSVDSILIKYYLNVTDFYHWSFGNYAVLSVDSSWNVLALMDSLKMLDGIITVELNGISGSAGMITYDVIEDVRYYHFTYEWQDCFDGCDANKTWKFKVYPDCSVEYLGYDYWCLFDSFEIPCDPMPEPSNCNIFTKISKNFEPKIDFVIYPNPFSTSTQLKSSYYFSNATLIIYNSLGRNVKQFENIFGHTILIDREKLPNGIYFINVLQDSKILFNDKILIFD